MKYGTTKKKIAHIIVEDSGNWLGRILVHFLREVDFAHRYF